MVNMPWDKRRPLATAAKSTPSSLAPSFDSQPYARGAGQHSQLQKRSVQQLRRWSRTNPWIRAAINLRRGQVSRARWDIVPHDAGVTENYEVTQRIREFLRAPNERGDSWRSFIEPIVEDLLVLDQGVIEKELTVGRRAGLNVNPIKNLWPKDAGRIAFAPNWDGSEPKSVRYFEYDDAGKVVAEYKNDEMIVIIANPVTYSPLGLSPIEVLAETIEADLKAAQYNANMVEQAVPPGIINLGEGVRPDQVDAFRAYWDAEIAGRSQTAIIGGGKGVNWIPMAQSNRDMQFLEWQIYLARKICAAFGVQPQDIGISFDVNRSSAEVGAQLTADNGILPLMDLVADYITREVVWAFDKTLRFAYTDMGRASASVMGDYYKQALSGLPWLRLNDALKERGQEGVGHLGDQVWFPSPLGYMPLEFYELYLKQKVGDPEATEPDPDAPGEGGTPIRPEEPPHQGPPVGSSDAPKPDGGEAAKPAPQMGPNQTPQKTKKSLARKIVVADADGIFEESGEINFEMIDALEDLAGEYPVYLVSSRPESAAKSILADLEEFEIKIEKSMFSTFPAGSGDHYKKYAASIIAREGNEVVCTIGAVGDGLSGLSEKSIEISKADGKINLDVPAAVKAEAQRGLDWRKEFGRGGIGPGQLTARMLIGNRMTVARVRKMRAYLARHLVDKKGEGFKPGQKGFPSAGRIAWALWGGDAGVSYANRVMRSVEAKEGK